METGLRKVDANAWNCHGNSWKIDGAIDGRLMGNSENMDRKWMKPGSKTDGKRMEHGWKIDGTWADKSWKDS